MSEVKVLVAPVFASEWDYRPLNNDIFNFPDRPSSVVKSADDPRNHPYGHYSTSTLLPTFSTDVKNSFIRNYFTIQDIKFREDMILIPKLIQLRRYSQLEYPHTFKPF
jgi:hypothetical protein